MKGTIQNEMADQAANMSHMDSTMFNQFAAMAGSQMNHYADDDESDRIVSPLLDLLDIAGYNYASGRYELDGKAHSDRIILGSETFPQDIPQNWKTVEKCPWLIGDFMWTAWDYIGEAGLGAWSYSPDAINFAKPYPWLLSGSGVIDLTGHGEGGALLAKAVWKSNGGKAGIAVTPAHHPGEEVIKSVWRGTNAIPSWSWKGCERKIAFLALSGMGNQRNGNGNWLSTDRICNILLYGCARPKSGNYWNAYDDCTIY